MHFRPGGQRGGGDLVAPDLGKAAGVKLVCRQGVKAVSWCANHEKVEKLAGVLMLGARTAVVGRRGQCGPSRGGDGKHWFDLV